VGGFNKFAYNDLDGSTGYDRVYPVQFTGYDSKFHEAHINVQPLPFATMDDDYFMINGRGYPHVIDTAATAVTNKNGFRAQPEHTLIVANQGESVLLRVSNVITTDLLSFATTLGVPMKVVGRAAEILRSPDLVDISFDTQVLYVAGGESYDVIVDTTGVAPGTYFLYTTNLHFLSNGAEERGGAMTEIVIGNPGQFPPQG
jgi:FtsP/CotA-like multicopper oxidase with cupredoxin domain